MKGNVLIHATRRWETLLSILETSSLRLSYSKEDFCIQGKKISSAAHPMVCFSLYNKSSLANSINSYGEYGVAFTKEWALNKRISPVAYMEDSSIAAKGLATLLRARQNKENKIDEKLRLPIMEIKCFTKNVRGYNSGLDIKDFDFQRENEWRYVPRKRDIGNNLISQNQRTYKKNPEKYDAKLLPYPFKFKLTDIDTVYVSSESERTIIAERFSIPLRKIEKSVWKNSY